MLSKEDIGPPRIIVPRNLRHLSHVQLHRRNDPEDSVSQVSTSVRTYASARKEEKELGELHASGGTWIELFYDLFFAASLSSFSRAREISGRRDLIDLAAFFTILWWTWSAQTLFDVRYSHHAKSEKFMKLLQLGVMIGYGVFAKEFTLFQVMSHESPAGSFTEHRHRASPKTSAIAIASLFVFSRITLGGQYLRVAVRQRHGETYASQIRNSVLLSAALPFIAGVFWLTSLFLADTSMEQHALLASRTALWVVGVLVEMIGSFAMRLYKRAGFEKSHLSERYGSLTIIILGEGIIKLVSILRDISSGVGFHIQSVVAIITSIVSFYLVFVLYFDDFSLHEKIPSVRAYSWAYMHYLFHLSLVLCLDGITSLLLFTNIFGGVQSLISSHTQSNVLHDLMNVDTGVLETVPMIVGKLSFDYTPLSTMMSINGTELSQSQYDYVFINLFSQIFQSYNVEPSEQFVELVHELEPNELATDVIQRAVHFLLNQFVVSAQFFLLAGGMIFLTMIPIMYWQKRMWTVNWSRFVPLMARFVAGVVMIGLGIMADLSKTKLNSTLVGGILLPAFMSAALLVYITDKVVVRYLQFT